MANFAFLESQKLISRKIWVIAKSWNFHTVLPQQPFLLKANLWRIFRPSRKASITCGQCRLSSNILGLWWFVMRTLLWTSRFGRSNTSKSYGMFIALLTRRLLQTLTLMEQHQLLRPEINLLFYYGISMCYSVAN